MRVPRRVPPDSDARLPATQAGAVHGDVRRPRARRAARAGARRRLDRVAAVRGSDARRARHGRRARQRPAGALPGRQGHDGQPLGGGAAAAGEWCAYRQATGRVDYYYQSLLIISPVTRCAATWPLEPELKLFLSNAVRMSTATEMCTARS